MRDIRSDLRERLTGAERRRIAAQKMLAEVDSEVNLLTSLLELEASRTLHEMPKEAPERSLGEFIVDLIRKEPTPKDMIRDYAVKAGLFGSSESPGRVIHATLVNLERAGRVQVDEAGRYVEAVPKYNNIGDLAEAAQDELDLARNSARALANSQDSTWVSAGSLLESFSKKFGPQS